MSTGISHPLLCIITEAAQCPASMHFLKSLFFTNCDKNPPAKESPAPLVSTIFSGGTSCTSKTSLNFNFSFL